MSIDVKQNHICNNTFDFILDLKLFIMVVQAKYFNTYTVEYR